MKIRGFARYQPSKRCAAVTLALACFAIGCGGNAAPPKSQYDMGERVKVGALTYNVIESEWKSQLGEFPAGRTPSRNFLLVRVSVTNGGGSHKTLSSLTVENSTGDSFVEEGNGANVQNWLGLLRRLPPAQTEEGWVLFDVPTNSYRLKVTDSNEAGDEKVAYINIPLRLEQHPQQ